MGAQFGGNFVEEYLELLLANGGQTAPHAKEARSSSLNTHSGTATRASAEMDATDWNAGEISFQDLYGPA